MSSANRNFSEREFYLSEFRHRSIGFAWPTDERAAPEVFAPLVEALIRNETRVILMSPRADLLGDLAVVNPVVDFAAPNFAPELWHALHEKGCASLRLDESRFEVECRDAAIALGLSKIVWIQSAPPVKRRDKATRVSVVDLAHLGSLLGDSRDSVDSDGFEARADRLPLLEAVRDMIRAGVPSVNVCAGSEVERELLTYGGAGIFFTRDRYAEVRPLTLDDFDPATDLMSRGEADGFLVPRDQASRDAVLSHGVGLFIEGRYLAGIGAILPYSVDCAAEIASLYALTRYAGEGVGSQIVRYAIDQVRSKGLDYVFSCTTSDRVERFFVENGFHPVEADQVPQSKWNQYDPTRRSRVRCLRFDV